MSNEHYTARRELLSVLLHPLSKSANLWVVFCLLTLTCGQVHAAWFQATGQAVIHNGDKQLARQQATQEAIKQALLFAGASVTSVQQLTNGLLQNDNLEVRSTGEVNRIEMIDEVYHRDFVTVSIRADIFPQEAQCSASGYTKSIITAHMPFVDRQQTQDGNMFALSQAAMEQLPQIFDRSAPHAELTAIIPERYNWESPVVQQQAFSLAQQYDSQYVLAITALDVSVQRPKSTLAFWRDTTPQRTFTVRARVFDGMSSKIVADSTHSITAPWPHSKFDSVNVHSREFWVSQYGQAITRVLEGIVSETNELLACERAIGRVLQVANNQLQINLGQQHNVQAGDSLNLYQTKLLVDSFGQQYRQHVIHPTVVVVQQVFADSATVTAIDGSLLADIQTNDYVVKR
ncbi:flagellar assembly protein T N-terminal domain-containing protein [Alteromonas sp. ASW11-36]|uniref:Flagellar assembly protein T N-terminal domain-containing protein n=1 Tax=Alteromonas arenosi TaxID=3055817 RepID=A0ABT7SVI2_9ALTE|nr:flagella assembly protein FlgT [Alteromonas sp. ASW11-36]MDM7860181.1 flagellar assembly protein T N-terminal domain-containing protein [Alteromonas sp. ASW11-36]